MGLNFSKQLTSQDITLLLKLAIPLVLTGLVQASISFFSTLFLAHLGHEDLAAGAIVSWMFATLMVILWGTLSSVSVLVSLKHGAKDKVGAAFVLRDAILLALIFVLPASLLLWNIAPILLFLGQSPTTVLLAQQYMRGLMWGLLPDFITLVLMQFLVGLGDVRTNMVFSLLGVPLNIACNYILMFGKLGFPALGIAGIGWGTTLAFWIWGIILVVYLFFKPHYRAYLLAAWHWKPPHYFGELCKIGLPMGGMYAIEVGFFFTLTLVMGHFNSQYLAANQIALQYLGQLSVVTFAISQAISVRMGHGLGANDITSAQRACYAGIIITVGFMTLVAFCYWFFPRQLIGIDLNIHQSRNLQIVQDAEKYLSISAIFQLLEAVRFSLFGALRSLKDTRFTLIISIISFWGIALPIGYALTKYLHNGVGFWWGLVFGALIAAILLYQRFQRKMQNYIKSSDLNLTAS